MFVKWKGNTRRRRESAASGYSWEKLSLFLLDHAHQSFTHTQTPFGMASPAGYVN